VLVFRDVTQQFELQKRTEQINLELEEKVKKRTAELEAINKEMESFSYSVSHDLRAPLRAITGFSRILASEYQEKLGEEGQRYLQMIIDNSNNMGQLIDDLLEFSKLGRKDLKVEKLNMTQTVKSIWAEQISLLPENSAELELDEMPDVIADGAMLRQVWVNLISNALKFSSRQDKPLIKIGAQENGNAITYHIKDNGVGFDMKYYNKLFGVFQRLHSSADFEGTGVGLALSHRIINRHGGQIWAESAPNVGTTFYFTIPINHGKSS
jgi:light-regulated signal transduction histidine kinase (bacteriophytochrome)